MSTILILGNGFDLALGRKTSYSDFIQSEQFEQHSQSLFYHLKNQMRLKNWVDVEISLGEFAKKFDFNHEKKLIYGGRDRLNAIDKFRKEYRLLKSALIEYLIYDQENWSGDTKFSHLFLKWIDDLVNKSGNLDIVTFNYTESIKHILGKRDEINIYEIHNNIKGNIIFGTEDIDETLGNEFSFIRKSIATHFGQIYNFYDRFQTIDNIIFYGHSLGLTDFDYFQKHFLQIANLSNRGNKKIVIYYFDGNQNDPFGQDAKDSINMNLSAMLGRKLPDFKHNCSLNFLPTTSFG